MGHESERKTTRQVIAAMGKVAAIQDVLDDIVAETEEIHETLASCSGLADALAAALRALNGALATLGVAKRPAQMNLDEVMREVRVKNPSLSGEQLGNIVLAATRSAGGEQAEAPGEEPKEADQPQPSPVSVRDIALANLLAEVGIRVSGHLPWSEESWERIDRWASAALRHDQGETIHVPLLPEELMPTRAQVQAVAHRIEEAGDIGSTLEWCQEHLATITPAIEYVLTALESCEIIAMGKRKKLVATGEGLDDAAWQFIEQGINNLAQRRDIDDHGTPA